MHSYASTVHHPDVQAFQYTITAIMSHNLLLPRRPGYALTAKMSHVFASDLHTSIATVRPTYCMLRGFTRVESTRFRSAGVLAVACSVAVFFIVISTTASSNISVFLQGHLRQAPGFRATGTIAHLRRAKGGFSTHQPLASQSDSGATAETSPVTLVPESKQHAYHLEPQTDAQDKDSTTRTHTEELGLEATAETVNLATDDVVCCPVLSSKLLLHRNCCFCAQPAPLVAQAPTNSVRSFVGKGTT